MSTTIITTPRIRIQLVKSPIGCKEIHRATIRGLGLRKIRSVSDLTDTPSVRGMIKKVSYLIRLV